MDYMERLNLWWRSQCDGEWEHEFGVIIQTMDNPGWLVKIDLTYTGLDEKPMDQITEQRSGSDWYKCSITDGAASGSNETGFAHFVGMGGPGNLRDILEVFLSFAQR